MIVELIIKSTKYNQPRSINLKLLGLASFIGEFVFNKTNIVVC